MNGKVILVTGAPGVGKSYLSRALEAAVQPLKTLGFGEFILRFRQGQALEAEYEDLRQQPTESATLNSISQATEFLITELGRLRAETNVLIDSHAVVKDDYGFRVTPDSIEVLRKLNLSAIINIHDDPYRIITRVDQDRGGRHLVTPQSVTAHMALQDSVSMAYGVATGCPVFILDRGNSADDDIAMILRIFDSLDVQYSRYETENT